MKVLAIIDVAEGAPLDQIKSRMQEELLASWSLFVSGAIREAYLTSSPTRVVFILEADDAPDALKRLQQLPLISAGFFRVSLEELRPFANWSRLFPAGSAE